MWETLPHLCLARICAFSRSFKTFHTLRLVCAKFYNELPIPVEVMGKFININYLSYNDYHSKGENTVQKLMLLMTSLGSIQWAIRISGSNINDCIPDRDETFAGIAPCCDLHVVKFFIHYYLQHDHPLIKNVISVFQTIDIDINTPMTLQDIKIVVKYELYKYENLYKRKYLIKDEEKYCIENKIYHWFRRACEGGDLKCIQYALKYLIADDNVARSAIYMGTICLSGSVSVWEWYTNEYQIGHIYTKHVLNNSCESGNVLFLKYMMKRHLLHIDVTDIVMASKKSCLDFVLDRSNYMCTLAYALRSGCYDMYEEVCSIYHVNKNDHYIWMVPVAANTNRGTQLDREKIIYDILKSANPYCYMLNMIFEHYFYSFVFQVHKKTSLNMFTTLFRLLTNPNYIEDLIKQYFISEDGLHGSIKRAFYAASIKYGPGKSYKNH